MRRVVVCLVLASCAGDSLEERLRLYRPRVEAATTAGKAPADVERLASIVAELVRAGDLELVEALERECDDDERHQVFWSTLARTGRTPQARRLLERWAAREPDSIELAAYRPGGLDYLLTRLEDPAETPQARAHCAWALAQAGDVSALPRLRALVDDPTPVPLRSLRAGSGVPTLGSIVARCIPVLEKRAGRQ